MDLDDRITISTPEGLLLALDLAGLGSRFIAGAVDLVIELAVLGILAVITGVVGGFSGALGVVYIVLAFAIWFLYPIGFELLGSGQTPGKRMTHLRVVRDSGAPVDPPASAIRNLVRVLDGPLLLFVPTIISIAVTARNQRPGDLAAGTLVIRESPMAETPAPSSEEVAVPDWDVSAISIAEIAAVRRFLERRESLDGGARSALAARLAAGLRAKVAGAPEGESAEAFLEQLARAKR